MTAQNPIPSLKPRAGAVRSRALLSTLALAATLTVTLAGATSALAASTRTVSAPVLTITAKGVRLPAARVVRRGLASSRVKVKAHHKPARPAITTQPKSLYTAPGSYARLAAAASGFPKPRAQWQISNNHGARWRNIRGVRGSAFTFMAVTGQDGDEFRAIFKNKHGRAATAAATLTVVAGYTAPLIQGQPSNLTVGAGANATFTAVAYGDPAPTLQWQISGNNGASWDNVAGATSPTLTFLASSILNGYEFRALFTNVLGTALSSTATLTVNGYAGGAPVVTQQPQVQDVATGVPVSFTAAAAGSPAPSVQWQVSTDSGQTWAEIPGATSTTYAFTTTADENRYEYQAVFTNAEGTATTDPAVLGVGYLLASNWAGYAAFGGGSYTAVSANWTVPSVQCPAGSSGSRSSQWVGIDGVEDQTVEQDGTSADCNGAVPTYGAWYEMVGDSAVNGGAEVDISPTSYPVHAGDSISASVSVNVTSQWTLTIHDATQNWTYTPSPAIYWTVPQQSSAEWIAERPELCDNDGNCSLTPLSDFGTVTFSNATATNDAVPQSIAALGGTPIQMIRSDTDSTLLAAPSSLDSTGEIFSDTWYAGF